jgi:hypothetical protein
MEERIGLCRMDSKKKKKPDIRMDVACGRFLLSRQTISYIPPPYQHAQVPTNQIFKSYRTSKLFSLLLL